MLVIIMYINYMQGVYIELPCDHYTMLTFTVCDCGHTTLTSMVCDHVCACTCIT